MKTKLTSLGTSTAALLLAVTVWNCGDDTPTPAGGYAGNTVATGGKAGTSSVSGGGSGGTTNNGGTGGTASNEPSLNGCKENDYVDLSEESATRTITAPDTSAYSPRCVSIKAGQLIMFNVNFEFHPTVAGKRGPSTLEGSAGNPIGENRTGTGKEITFPTAGNFPFYCTAHLPMNGVVRVLP